MSRSSSIPASPGCSPLCWGHCGGSPSSASPAPAGPGSGPRSTDTRTSSGWEYCYGDGETQLLTQQSPAIKGETAFQFSERWVCVVYSTAQPCRNYPPETSSLHSAPLQGLTSCLPKGCLRHTHNWPDAFPGPMQNVINLVVICLLPSHSVRTMGPLVAA